MSIRTILLPVFVEVALTFLLLFWSTSLRAPETAAPNSSAFRSEIDLSVLFYVLTILAWQTQFADFLFVVLAWAFVVLRVVHGLGIIADQPWPLAPLHFASAGVLAIMWLIYALRLLLALG